MSARQNKKQRKGRNNPNNRERTVTTLTEDPNSSYLIPLTSEDPPGALMSSPFSIASSAGNLPSSSAYQPPSSYEAYGYTDFSSQPQIFSQQVQQQQKTQVSPIPGKNDLERLENLKSIIKANQHASYRPIPQPAALAAHYLGSFPTSQAQLEQNNTDGLSQTISNTGSSPSSPADHGRRPPRLQTKEWENPARGKSTTTNGGQPTNNVLSDSSPISAFLLTSSSSFSFSTQTNSPIQGYEGRFNQGTNAPPVIDTSNLQSGSKINSAVPLSAGPKSVDVQMSDTQSAGPGPSPRFDSSGARSSVDNRLVHGETGYGGPRVPSSTDKTSFDSKNDLRTPRDSSWSMRDGPLPSPDDRRRDLDRPPPSPRPALNGSGGGSDTRSNPTDRPLIPRDAVPPRDDRFYDRDRERERERYDRERRDWDRDRRASYDRFRPPPDVTRRPPPEQRHYEPDYSDRGPPPARRYDIVKEEPISDSRRLADLRKPLSPMADDRPPVRSEDDRLPLSSRLPLPTSSIDSRVPPPVDVSRPPPDSRPPVPPQRAPSPDNRSVRRPSFDDRHVKPSALSEERRVAPVSPDVRVPSGSVRPADIPVVNRPADRDRDRERDVPLVPVDVPRPSIPLEERISRPSLQERISNAQPEHLSQPPPASRPEPGRPLEERLSTIPVSADSREPRGRIPERAERPPPPPSRPPQPIDDRVASRPPPPPAVSTQDDRRIDDRPGRYTRGMSPAGERSTYPPPVRDDAVSNKVPSPRSGVRDYRAPPRPISRERTTTTYRPDERNYISDDRRSDAMDVDTPSRYNDSRPVPYNRPFSPPSAADLARDRARAAQQYPPSPSRPPPPHDAHSYDDERRYSSSRDWAPSYQSSYSERRREWTAADEEYYKSRQWDRNPPPPPPPAASAPERERYERDPPPPVARNTGWETRDERERRDYPPPRAPSPARTYDGPSRSLSSRLTDTYSSSAPGGASADRSYPTRDAPPAFSRVRQRSLSPPRRPGVPVIDDNRPPVKRSREDGYGAGEYYPPSSTASARDLVPPIRRPDSYPSLSRGASPPAPSSGGSAYFDGRAPPPSSSAGSGGDRDYPPRDYSVQSYDRPRSPPRGAAYSRGGYSRDTRDDRRYPPPPPPSSMLPPRRP